MLLPYTQKREENRMGLPERVVIPSDMSDPDGIHNSRMFFKPAGFSTHGERESAPPEQLMQPDDKWTTIPANPGKDLV